MKRNDKKNTEQKEYIIDMRDSGLRSDIRKRQKFSDLTLILGCLTAGAGMISDMVSGGARTAMAVALSVTGIMIMLAGIPARRNRNKHTNTKDSKK